jgi:hypothetical protein
MDDVLKSNVVNSDFIKSLSFLGFSYFITNTCLISRNIA